jgi:hypothetical protein
MKSGHDTQGEQDSQAALGDVEAFDGEHLSEAALVLIADGAADVTSARARDHAESCRRCAAAIAEQAFAASELHTAFAALAPPERERLAAPALAKTDRSSLVRRHTAKAARSRQAADEVVRAEVDGGTEKIEDPSTARQRPRGGAWWIAGGLLVAGVASAPTIRGIARAISEARDAMLVVVAVGVQIAESLRVDPARMGSVQATASWTATLAMILAGVWIARRDGRRGVATGTERAEAKGTR